MSALDDKLEALAVTYRGNAYGEYTHDFMLNFARAAAALGAEHQQKRCSDAGCMWCTQEIVGALAAKRSGNGSE
jgi:hypothetical protein